MTIKISRAGECVRKPADATASLRRGAGRLLHAGPMQVSAALTSEEAGSPLGFLAQTISIVAQMLAALLMLGELSVVLQHAQKSHLQVVPDFHY